MPVSDQKSNAYHDDGPQSRNEAYIALAGTISERRRNVLSAIIEAGEYGVTLDELAMRFNVSPNAISGRVTELKRQGLCRHTEARRRTRAGSSASVIVAITGGS